MKNEEYKMEKLVSLEDVLEFILLADDIELDSSSGSDINIPIYDITAEEFLEFAENAIAVETKEGLINAVSNLKRALDCEIDLFFESINIKHVFSKNNLKFEKKTQFLSDIGLLPVHTINKLNTMRNKMEHDYEVPVIDDLRTYYELVWNVVKILDLYLELIYINGEISMSLMKGDNEYYFSIEHDAKNRGFKIEIRDWTKGAENKCKQIEFNLKSKDDEVCYIKFFSFYLLSIKFFDFYNIVSYKNGVRKLMK